MTTKVYGAILTGPWVTGTYLEGSDGDTIVVSDDFAGCLFLTG